MVLRDKTRRRIARITLLLFGWLPLLGLILVAVFLHSDLYDDWARYMLSTQLEMQTSFRRFEHPCWDTSRFENVTFSNPETGKEVLSCRLLEVERQQKRDKRTPILRLRLSDCTINLNNGRPLWTFIERAFTHRKISNNSRVELTINNITFTSPYNETFCRISGTIEDIANGAEGEFRVWQSSQTDSFGRTLPLSEDDSALFRIMRIRDASPPTTALVVDTTRHPISTKLLAYWRPLLNRLGNARFAGTLYAANNEGTWSGNVNGQFQNAQLDAIFPGSAASAPRCRGNALITLTQGLFRDEQLLQAQGEVLSEGGWIDRGVVNQAVSQMKLSGAGTFNPYNQTIPFRRLQFTFFLENEMVRVQGSCPDATRGTILVSEQLPLLRESFSKSAHTPVSVVKKILNPSEQFDVIQIASPVRGLR